MIEFIVLLIVAAFFYWRGVVSGYKTKMRSELEDVLRLLPINIEIKEDNGIFYAYFLATNQFIKQSTSKEELIEKLQEQFPEQQIIVTDEAI